MNKYGRIALCIPAFNAASYLPRLLMSAKKQIVPFDDILVYDDCSKDDTAEIAVKFGARVIRGSVNRGCSHGKNVLLNTTECEWIHFHDADDELLPNFTNLAQAWIGRKDCPDVVLFDYEYRRDDDGTLINRQYFDNDLLSIDPIRYAILNQINPFCGLYRRDKLLMVGGYDTDPEILYNEDVAFHCKLAIAGFSFRSESEVSIINYRISNSMSVSNQLKCAQAHYHVMKKNSEKVGQVYAKEIAQKLWKNAVNCASMNDWDTCRRSVTLACSLSGRAPQSENFFIRLFSLISPFWAIKGRERIIRLLKPQMRPGV